MITQLERKALNQLKACLDEARNASYMWTWDKAFKEKLDAPENIHFKRGIEEQLKKIHEKIGEAESWIGAVTEVKL